MVRAVAALDSFPLTAPLLRLSLIASTAALQFWYLVDESWLRRWREFVKAENCRDLTRAATWRLRLPPGPILNHRLLDAHGTPLPHLEKVVHYRGVNVNVSEHPFEAYRIAMFKSRLCSAAQTDSSSATPHCATFALSIGRSGMFF
jgi:hypothetical protein